MASGNLSSLGKRMQRRADQLNKTIEAAVRQGALAALRAATAATPVDTGNARVNWNVSVKKPVVTVKNLAKGTTLSKGEASKRAIGRARDIIKGFNVKSKVIWLTNGVRYIKGLDTGGVSKKGGQMSAKAIIAGRRAIQARLAKGLFKRGS